jgi:hypothetical protein
MRTAAFVLSLLSFSAPARAGQTVVDFEVLAMICATSSTPTYRITKELADVKTGVGITEQEYRDLLVAADFSSCSGFDSEASSILGSWYDNLPETLGNPAKTALCELFQHLQDAD